MHALNILEFAAAIALVIKPELAFKYLEALDITDLPGAKPKSASGTSTGAGTGSSVDAGLGGLDLHDPQVQQMFKNSM